MIEEKKIIIPTSKYIDSKLQKIFGKIPSVLIPVEGNITLLEKISINNSNSKIFVVSNQGSSQINEIISLRKLNNVINFEIDSTTSLKDTLLSIEEFLTGQITILLGDTSIKEFSLSKYIGTDSISFSKISSNFNSEDWTHFIWENNSINIFDKINTNFKSLLVFNGIYNFKDSNLFMNYLKEETDFYTALKKYILNKSPNFIEESEWIDFGNEENFKKNSIVQPRFFNEIIINERQNKLTKKSSLTAKFSDEIYWMVNIPSHLKKFLPKIFDYSLENELFIEMEYINTPSISEVFMKGSHNYSFWNKLLLKLFLIKEEFNKFNTRLEDINEQLIYMYYTKTINRLEESYQDFSTLFVDKITINNIDYKGLKWIMKNLKNIIEVSLLNIDDFNIIHGDFFFANILKENDQIYLIDPRGSFGAGSSFYGDKRYDIAKLSHSVRGKYDVIINDNFIINKWEKNNIEYMFTNANNTSMIEELIRLYSSRFGYKYDTEILLIESLLFLSMSPLHKDFPERQKIMLIRGIELFNKFLEVKNDN